MGWHEFSESTDLALDVAADTVSQIVGQERIERWHFGGSGVSSGLCCCRAHDVAVLLVFVP